MGNMLPSVYQFGLLNLVLPIQFLVIVLSSSGISPAIARFIAQLNEKNDLEAKERLISSVLFYFTAIGVVFAVLILILSDFIAIKVFNEPRVSLLIKISGAAVPFGILIAVYTGIFQGNLKMGNMSITLLFEQLSRIVFAVILVAAGYQASGAIMGSTLGFIVTVPFAYLLYKKLGYKSSKIDFSVFKEVFLFTIPISITAISSFLLAYVDIILLGIFLTPHDVGIYSAASPTARLVLAFSAALYAVIIPSISGMATAKDRKGMQETVGYSYRISLGVILPVTFFSYVFAEKIIGVLFPLEFPGAVEPFRILLIGTVFLGIFTLNSGVFQGLGKPSVPMKILLAASAMDILLNIYLIPIYYVEGAAIASSLSFAFAGLVSSAWLFLLFKNKM